MGQSIKMKRWLKVKNKCSVASGNYVNNALNHTKVCTEICKVVCKQKSSNRKRILLHCEVGAEGVAEGAFQVNSKGIITQQQPV